MEFSRALILVLVVHGLVVIVSCDVFPACESVINEVFIAMPGNCSEYIYCDGSESFKDVCPAGYLFNPDNSMCDDPVNVNCSDNEQTSSVSTTATAESTSSSTIQTNSPSSPSSSTSSGGAQTEPTITTTTISTTPTTSGPGPIGPSDICPISSSNQAESILKPGSCKNYYLCYNGYPIEMECPNNLEFNAVKKQCDWASEANCVANPTTTVKPLELCASKTNGFFRYPDNCRYYYRCTNGMLTVQECPVGYGWDDNRKSCTPKGCSVQH